MSYYYWKNREELLKKAHDKHYNKAGKEKAKRYQENKEEIKLRERDRYNNITDREK